MSVVELAASTRVRGVETGMQAEVMHAISKPGCAAAVWLRRLEPGVQTWLDTRAPDTLPQARVVAPSASVPDVVQHVCDGSGLPPSPERAWLEQDIVRLAQTFATVMKAPYLRIRIDRIATNACRRFHLDAVTARLVCTYRGPGTQYGTPSPLGGDPERIVTAPTGAPILLRGTLWPETPSAGLRHRSPPIEGTGETRLLLVLDPVSTPDDDL